MEFSKGSFALQGASSYIGSSMGGAGASDPTILLEKLGEDYMEQAKAFEGSGKVDKAYKFYNEAAKKFDYILTNFAGTFEPGRE
jgi:hypothetical protein